MMAFLPHVPAISSVLERRRALSMHHSRRRTMISSTQLTCQRNSTLDNACSIHPSAREKRGPAINTACWHSKWINACICTVRKLPCTTHDILLPLVHSIKRRSQVTNLPHGSGDPRAHCVDVLRHWIVHSRLLLRCMVPTNQKHTGIRTPSEEFLT